MRIGTTIIPSVDLIKADAQRGAQLGAFNKAVADALTTAGYPAAANPSVVKMAHPADIFRSQPFAMNVQSGNIYHGRWYPIVVAAMTVVIGTIFVPETKDRDIFAADTAPQPGAK